MWGAAAEEDAPAGGVCDAERTEERSYSLLRYLQPRCAAVLPRRALQCRGRRQDPRGRSPAAAACGVLPTGPGAQPCAGCRARGGGRASGSAPERCSGDERGPAQCKFGQMSPLGFGLGESTSSRGLVKWSRRLQLCEALVEVAGGAQGA